MKRLFATVAAAALFCAGGACGWLMRGDGGTGVPPVQPDQAVDSRVAPNGRPARSPDEEVAEPQFAEAISVEEFRRQQEARTALLEAAARSVGVEGAEDLKRFRETISSIFEATRELESGARRQRPDWTFRRRLEIRASQTGGWQM